jgi:hypothetical protein
MTTTEKAKEFLQRQLDEHNAKIRKLKRKRKFVKVAFVTLIITSITSSTVCATIVGFTLPPFIIPILATTAGLTTAFSAKFNLEGRKAELNKTIEELDKIRHKIDYVVSCNIDFTQNDYKQLLNDLLL